MTSMEDYKDPDTGEVWASSERPMSVQVWQYARKGPLLGPRLVVTDLPASRRVTFGVVTDDGEMRIRISVKMARRLARFILDHSEDEKQPSDGRSYPDSRPSEGKPGKREDGAKEEQTKAVEEEKPQNFSDGF